MAKKRILVVDDEEDILELVKYNLVKNGYEVSTASSGEEGLQIARATLPDMVILDVMLPGVDGLDVCKLLKSDSRTRPMAVVMLTAKGDEADIVTGLELGADDYIVKPFSPRVLLARVKAVFRREYVGASDTQATLKVNELMIVPDRRQVFLEGRLTELTNTEFKILHLLARRPGVVFTRYQIVDQVHGSDYPVTDRSIDVQIVGLRRKLGKLGNLLETVRAVGYRFRDIVVNHEEAA